MVAFVLIAGIVFVSAKTFPQDYTQEEIEQVIQNYINHESRKGKITWQTDFDRQLFSLSENPFINGAFYKK